MMAAATRLLCAVAASVATLAASSAAAQRLPGDYYNEFHFGYPTPHTPWGKPLAGGKLRVFFIAPTHAAREVTEIAQRLDMEVGGETAIYSYALGDESRYVAQIQGTSTQEKKASILRKLSRPYEVYVLANFPVSKLPVELQFEILKRVKEGAGLVLTYKREAPQQMWRHPVPEASSFVREVPIAGLTFYRTKFLEAQKLADISQVPGELVKGYRIGQGRVVLIDYGIQSPVRIAGGFCLTPHEFYTYRTLTEYDYHQSLVAKAILWAAKREPAVRFVDLPVEGYRLAAAAPRRLRVAVENLSRARINARVEVRVRNEWGEVEAQEQMRVALRPGVQEVEVRLPALPGGTHFLDMRLVSRRGVEGWASAALLITADPSIARVEMAKLSYERDEPCRGTVRLSRPPGGTGYTVRVVLVDNYGRRFCRGEVPVGPRKAEVQFSLGLEASVSLGGRARVLLLRGAQALDQKEEEFFVCQRNDDYFPALVWGNLPGIFGHFAGVQLHKVGVNSILHYYGEGIHEGRRPSTIAREDFHAVPYVTRISWKDGRLGAIETNTKFKEFLQERAKQSRPFDPLCYSLGDENFIPPEGGFHPNERQAFIAFLKKRYKTVEELNQAWGTELESFDQAAPIRAAEAARTGQFARFHDTEAFREYLYAKWHHWCHDVIKEVDPRRRIGAEGSVPGEMELTIRGLEFWGPYRRVDQNTLLRSLAPRSLLRGNWFGGYNAGRRDPINLPRFLWESILDGSTMIEMYCSYTCENFYNTDLTWAYWMEYFLPDLKEITDGLGQLLAHSEHACDPVAVLHSQPSVHFEKLSAPFGRYEAAQRAALRMLEDLSWVPYYVTSRQVEGGALRAKQPRILLLPHAAALSDAEVTAIEMFVRSGGVLIADVRPGIADGRCNRRQMAALDRLFGVKRRAAEARAIEGKLTVKGRWTSRPLRLDFRQLQIDGVSADANVVCAGGTALGSVGEAPAMIVNQIDSGAAVLLNFSFHEYTAHVGKRGERVAVPLAQALLYGTGLRPRWQLMSPSGAPVAGARVASFRRGAAEIVGLLAPRGKHPDKTLKAVVVAPRAAHLYDMRAGKYLGHRSQVGVALKYASATFISALPYRVTGLKLRVPAVIRAGRRCPANVAIEAEGDTSNAKPVLRVKVIGPDGEERHYYARTRYMDGLSTRVRIPFAFNDPPGVWRIVVRDILTGMQAEKAVRLVEEGGE